MAEPVKLEQLTSSEGETFRQLYAIYAASIAAREQKRESWIAAMICFLPSIASRGEGRRPRRAGFSIPVRAGGWGCALLEFMAVASDQRNHGLGAELVLRARLMKAARAPRGTPAPRAAGGSTRTGKPPAIAALWTRQGGASTSASAALRLAKLRYLMPLPGEGSPPEMDLPHLPRRRRRSATRPQSRGLMERRPTKRRQTMARDHLPRGLPLLAGRSAPRADGGRPARSHTARLNEEGEPTWKVGPPS